MLTKEEIEILEKLQGNEYTAEYFFIQLKKDPQYVEILSERVQAERKMIENKKTDGNGIDISLEIIKTSEIALKSVLNYMSLTLIDMKYFDRSKAPDSFTYPNMEQIIDLLTEKFRMYFFPNEKRKDLSELNQFQITLKPESFYPFYMADFSNTIAGFNGKKKDNYNSFEDKLKVITDQGILEITDYSNLKGKKLNTLAKKLLDICILKLSQTLIYQSITPNNRSVSLTVEELAILLNQPLETDKQRERFIERIYTSAKQLQCLIWTQSNKNKIKKFRDLEFDNITLIARTRKRKNTFEIIFTEEAARLLALAPVCESFPTNLFQLDNRYGNAYEIGRKMIRHSNIDSNRAKGTECTLSIPKLIENSEIPTFKEIIEIKNRRDWKQQIKEQLENNLNHLKNVCFLKRWEYRTPTGESYTPKQADKLTAMEYQSLVVDYAINYSEEEQSKRLSREEKYNKNKDS